MNMEQLQMIMDMVQNVTDGALTVAIIYMVYMVLVEFLLPILITGALVYGCYRALRIIITAAGHANDLIRLRDSMGVGMPGGITDREIDLMHGWVSSHKKKE